MTLTVYVTCQRSLDDDKLTDTDPDPNIRVVHHTHYPDLCGLVDTIQLICLSSWLSFYPPPPLLFLSLPPPPTTNSSSLLNDERGKWAISYYSTLRERNNFLFVWDFRPTLVSNCLNKFSFRANMETCHTFGGTRRCGLSSTRHRDCLVYILWLWEGGGRFLCLHLAN